MNTLKEAKIKLTQVLLEDLNSRYQQVKQEIQSNLAQLQEMLTNSQYDEICLFLNDKYKAAAGAALTKASQRLEQRGPRRPPQSKPRNSYRPEEINPAIKGTIIFNLKHYSWDCSTACNESNFVPQ